MHNITFKFPDSYQYGPALFEFFELRKFHFVDELSWDVPHDQSYEMDQYDNPLAHYSLVLDDAGKVIAGARVLPTTAQWGSSSYMLRDAQLGQIAGIPGDAMAEPIVSPEVWECTRLVISPHVTSAADRRTCLGLVVDGLIHEAAENGGNRLISLSPVALMRSLRQLGFPTERIGEPYQGKEDGRRYAVLAMSPNVACASLPRAA